MCSEVTGAGLDLMLGRICIASSRLVVLRSCRGTYEKCTAQNGFGWDLLLTQVNFLHHILKHNPIKAVLVLLNFFYMFFFFVHVNEILFLLMLEFGYISARGSLVFCIYFFLFEGLHDLLFLFFVVSRSWFFERCYSFFVFFFFF